ncbi:hypothetical protein PTW32_00950 [Dechloromonas agitata]|uniref:hypothetical protein n=1 Tax=Dechloromonas agitata TaxID=73030 RepID=UPI00237D4C4A|nr:hypothetical protein [Dechloromonas agitata]MDE1543968.1 hypothetical protein [Dechloromonas agitata]
MNTASPTTHPHTTVPPLPAADQHAVVETRLWMEEHVWLYRILHCADNVSPTFRFPDLISASVSLLFSRPDAPTRIFRYLCGNLVLRDPQTPRRRESMWRSQYELLQDLQRSPANRHPNPKFQLDQLTTACVALCREEDESGNNLLRQARINMAERTQHGQASSSG